MQERAENERVTKNTVKLDLRNWTAVPKNGSSHWKILKCIATPDKTTWEQHSQSSEKHLLPHELPFLTTSQVIKRASENSVDPTTKCFRHTTRRARQLYNSNGRTKLEEATLQQSLAFPQPQLTRQRATKNSIELNTLYTALRVPIPNSHITIPAQGKRCSPLRNKHIFPGITFTRITVAFNSRTPQITQAIQREVTRQGQTP